MGDGGVTKASAEKHAGTQQIGQGQGMVRALNAQFLHQVQDGRSFFSWLFLARHRITQVLVLLRNGEGVVGVPNLGTSISR